MLTDPQKQEACRAACRARPQWKRQGGPEGEDGETLLWLPQNRWGRVKSCRVG